MEVKREGNSRPEGSLPDNVREGLMQNASDVCLIGTQGTPTSR